MIFRQIPRNRRRISYIDFSVTVKICRHRNILSFSTCQHFCDERTVPDAYLSVAVGIAWYRCHLRCCHRRCGGNWCWWCCCTCSICSCWFSSRICCCASDVCSCRLSCHSLRINYHCSGNSIVIFIVRSEFPVEDIFPSTSFAIFDTHSIFPSVSFSASLISGKSSPSV